MTKNMSKALMPFACNCNHLMIACKGQPTFQIMGQQRPNTRLASRRACSSGFVKTKSHQCDWRLWVEKDDMDVDEMAHVSSARGIRGPSN